MSPTVTDGRKWIIRFQLYLNSMIVVDKTNNNDFMSTSMSAAKTMRKSDVKSLGKGDTYDTVSTNHSITHIENYHPIGHDRAHLW